MKQLAHYISLEDETSSTIYIICTDKDKPETYDDIYLMLNYPTDDNSLLPKILLKIAGVMYSYSHNQDYIDENGDSVTLEDAGTYETYKQKDKEGWTANASYVNDEDSEEDLYECVVSGYGDSEIEAIKDCLETKKFLRKIGEEILNKALFKKVNEGIINKVNDNKEKTKDKKEDS